jgi:hypothetical protein
MMANFKKFPKGDDLCCNALVNFLTIPLPYINIIKALPSYTYALRPSNAG